MLTLLRLLVFWADSDMPGAIAYNHDEPDRRVGVKWSKRELRFWIHLEARRSPDLARLDRSDELEACVRMFVLAVSCFLACPPAFHIAD